MHINDYGYITDDSYRVGTIYFTSLFTKHGLGQEIFLSQGLCKLVEVKQAERQIGKCLETLPSFIAFLT